MSCFHIIAVKIQRLFLRHAVKHIGGHGRGNNGSINTGQGNTQSIHGGIRTDPPDLIAILCIDLRLDIINILNGPAVLYRVPRLLDVLFHSSHIIGIQNREQIFQKPKYLHMVAAFGLPSAAQIGQHGGDIHIESFHQQGILIGHISFLPGDIVIDAG